MSKRRQNGFTLVELVVVIMILGILAAVAAPRLFNTSGSATDNGLRTTLAIVRDAIELYAADNGGSLPPCAAGGSNFHTAMEPYLRGRFPDCPVGPAQNNSITPVTGSATSGEASPTDGWKFNTDDGTFICNFNGASNTSGITYDQF